MPNVFVSTAEDTLYMQIYSVTINFPNWGHKIPHKKDKKYLLIPSFSIPHPLPHNVYIAHTTNRMPEKTLLPTSPSVLSS
jgi:hypothetical protein